MSLLHWVEHLSESGSVLAFKAASQVPEPGSGLSKDAFVLAIQTHSQKESYHKFGTYFAGIDATHNTTMYENLNLFTIIVRDNFGHGE